MDNLNSNIENLLQPKEQKDVEESASTYEYKDTKWKIRHSILIFGTLTVAFMMAIPEIRAQIERKPTEGTLLFILCETILWAGSSWIIGRKNLPANYCCLLLTKCFIFYGDHFKRPLNLCELDWFNAGFLFVLKSALRNSLKWEQRMAFFSPLILIPAVTLCTDIDIGDYEVSSLVGTTVSTAWAMLILVSSMGVGQLGKFWIRFHFNACVIWAYFTSVMTFFNLLFLSQRAWKSYKGQMSLKRLSRNMAEIAVYSATVLIMIHYIPLIHSNFSFESMYSLSIYELLYRIIPSWGRENFSTLKLICELWMDNYKIFCPGLLHSMCESEMERENWFSMLVQ